MTRPVNDHAAGHERERVNPKEEIAMSDDLGSLPASPSVPTMLERMARAMGQVARGRAGLGPSDKPIDPDGFTMRAARAALLAIRGSEHALWSSGRCWVSGRRYGQYGDNKHYVYIQEPGKETRLIATFASRAKAEYMAARLNGFNERLDAILNGDA